MVKMKVFLHIFFIIWILTALYLFYGYFFKDFAEKGFANVKNIYFFYLFSPKTSWGFKIYFRVLITFVLILGIISYIIFVSNITFK